MRHVVLPGIELRSARARRRDTVARFLAREAWPVARLPTICVVNGRPLMRAHWRRRRLAAGDEVLFVSRPFGPGGGGNTALAIAGLIGVIALAAVAPYLVAALVPALAGTVGGSLLAGGIVLGGSLLIHALTAPKAPHADAGQPLHSINAAGNTARPLATIPVGYGRIRDYPDYAATPWSYFASVQGGVGNSQVMNVALNLGCGEYQVHQVWIGDTLLWDETLGYGAFTGFASVQYFPPGTPFTMFPTNIVVSPDVSGQTLAGPPRPPNPPINNTVGPFAASPPGTQITQVALDLILPAGCYFVNSSGDQGPASVHLVAQAQEIDDSGVPLGPMQVIWTAAQTFNTRQPMRFTVPVSVPAQGRWQVEMTRLDDSLSQLGENGANEVIWAGLRGMIVEENTFPGVSILGVTLEAFQNNGPLSAARISVLRTRKLPVWNGSAMVTTATRSPLWAAWDAATNTDYGAGYPSAKVDFATFVAMAADAAARGDTFDYAFKSAVAVPEAFDTILRATRCRHRWLGDVLSLVRDEYPAVPQMVLTDREIVRGSLSIEYVFNTEDSADALVGQYLDENTWRPADVQFPAAPFVPTKPATVQWDGIVNRQQAFNETGFLWLASQLRRTKVTLATEHDGRLLGAGAPVFVQSELPQSWGATGAIVARSGLLLTADRNVSYDGAGQQYIVIRKRDGRPWGPVKCAPGSGPKIILLDATDLAAVEAQQGTLDVARARADGADNPSYAIGAATTFAKRCLLLAAQPNGDHVTLSLVVDDATVHTTSPGTVPALPSGPAQVDPDFPAIVGLNAIFRQGVAEPRLDVSWWNSPGASSYEAAVSYDAGASWTPAYAGAGNGFSFVADYTSARIRVQAIGKHRGEFATVDVVKPTIVITNPVVGPQSLVAGLHDDVFNQLNASLDRIRAIEQTIASVAQEQDAANWNDKYRVKVNIAELHTSLGDLSATVEVNAAAFATLDAAFASFSTTVTASLGSLSASVATNSAAIATVDGKLAASYAVTLDVHGRSNGFKLLSDGTTADVIWDVDFFGVGSSAAGGDTVLPFGISIVNGAARIALHGDMLADGTITARHIVAGSISADQINSSYAMLNKGVSLGSAVSVTMTPPTGFVADGFGGLGKDITILTTTFTPTGTGRMVALFDARFGGSSGTVSGPGTIQFFVDFTVSSVTRSFALGPAFSWGGGSGPVIFNGQNASGSAGINGGANNAVTVTLRAHLSTTTASNGQTFTAGIDAADLICLEPHG